MSKAKREKWEIKHRLRLWMRRSGKGRRKRHCGKRLVFVSPVMVWPDNAERKVVKISLTKDEIDQLLTSLGFKA